MYYAQISASDEYFDTGVTGLVGVEAVEVLPFPVQTGITLDSRAFALLKVWIVIATTASNEIAIIMNIACLNIP